MCKREKMGKIIESRNERRERTRTSMNCTDVEGASSSNFGEDGLFALEVRERDWINLSVLNGWKTCENNWSR